MEFVSRYVSKQPDANGFVNYGESEHHVWQLLYERQAKIIPGRACEEFIRGLDILKLSPKQTPQLPDISARLKKITGWQVAPVPALIPARTFFELLNQRQFPAATFIRTEEELDYVKEPDIFHEIFGHCPLLTDPVYANFIHDYAQKVLSFPEADWPLLQRLFWFTVEFGLIKTQQGLRAYGGGILSSITETVYCVESDEPVRALFNPVAALRTPYRIDQLQSVYFVIEDFQQLFDFVKADVGSFLKRARTLHEFPPLFSVENLNPNIHIHAC